MEPLAIEEIVTPSLLVNLDQVEKNCKTMRDRFTAMGVSLRPHMKTHKTLEIGEIMTGGTKKKIVVSTVAEAEFYANGGFDDILYAFPFSQDKIPRLKKLSEDLELFHILLDDVEAADWLKDHILSHDKKWNIWVKVDIGGGRAGKPWDSPELISLIEHVFGASWCEFRGIYVHCGQTYDCRGDKEIRTVSGGVADHILELAKKLEAEGIKCPQFTTGSTPSCSSPGDAISKLTEVHPGNYVFYDYQQHMIGSCKTEEIAIRVATRVIGHYPHDNKILVDCGFLGLSHDGKGAMPNGVKCMVDGHPELKFFNVSQEVGYITVMDPNKKFDFSSFPRGKMLYLIPYHACATAAMHPFYYVQQSSKIIDKWAPCRGW